jgi:formylmethanofuran dehydrogenase subunit D
LYDFVNTEVKELSRKTFFEEYSVHTYCSIQDNMIYKQFIKTFTINYKGTPDFKIDLKYLTHCTFKSYNKSDDFQPLTINELLVNGKNITDKIKYCLTDTNDKLYNKQCYYAFKNEKDMQASTYSSDKITVCLKYVTFVEADDKLLTQRVYMPCKSFEYIFSYDPKIFNAIAEPFSFKDVLVEEACINKEKIKIIYTDNCIHVKMNDWILPGDGVIFLIDKV